MKFGAHMSTSGGVWRAIERGCGIGCEVIQFFVKNNMQWFAKPYAPVDITKYSEGLCASKLHAVFGHSGYLINLGADPGPNRDNSLKSLILEIGLADSIGLPFMVMHPGAHLGCGPDKGLGNIVAGLNEAFRATKGSKLRIALENTAGQGSCMGEKIEHIAAVYDRVDCPERLGVCLDTAHFFEAGYDIRTKEGWDKAIGEVEELIGLDQVLAFHLNDSKTDFNSRVDRHAGIGQGKIGKEAFRHIVNDPRFKDTPGCLETPKSEDLHEDVENLAILRSLLEGAGASPKPAKKAARPKRALAAKKV
ncbi:MAG TPA: deoxyribonuclease IV [Methylomirabilota bacterium]|nr:deoxyribonuclease IV [Methylomirabilota bacterium]